MSEAVFPDLPGRSPVIKRRPVWSTRKTEAYNGQETRVARRNWPRWRYTLSYDVLRGTPDLTRDEYLQLVGFYNARAGGFDDFLFLDPDYHRVTDHLFGIGGAGATAFRLSRPVDTWLEPVWAPMPAGLVILVDGIIQPPGNWSLGQYGQIVLNTAPAAGAELRWTGQYYMRMSFVSDEVEFERFLQGLGRAPTIELISGVFA